MTKTETILQAGKHIAVIASGRAFKSDEFEPHPEGVQRDPAAPRDGKFGAGERGAGEQEGVQDPSNLNEVGHGDQDPRQEKS